MKKTKKDLEMELKRAKKTVVQLQDRLSRAGTLDQQAEEIERQIEVRETEASMDVANIIEHCEAETGRTFVYRHGGTTLKKAKTSTTTKQLVQQLAERAAGKRHNWSNPCEFRRWAKPIFEKAWKEHFTL